MTIFDPSNETHARARDRLETEPFLWLTTVTSDGQPNTTPVWFWLDGERVHLYSQPGRPKLRNIAANPRVSLHLQSDRVGDEDVVILEGLAELEPEAPPAHLVPQYLDKYRGSIGSYGWTPESMAADFSIGVRIALTRIRAW